MMMKNILSFLILLILSNAVLVAQETNRNYPDFSWDKVPLAFHFGKKSGLLTPREARFIAKHSNIICLEKAHAIGQFENTEDVIEKETQQFKKLNPDMKVIFYWNAFLDYPMYYAHHEYEKHPEWWLKTKDGKLDLKQGQYKRYDLSNPEVRKWWVDVASKAVIEGSTDGVFMDAFPQISDPKNKKLWGDEKYEAIQRGLKTMIKQTRDKIGPDKLIFYNGIRSKPERNLKADYLGDYLDYVDAIMLEHFGHSQSASKECMLRDIQELERAGKMGKIVIFKGWPCYPSSYKEFMDFEEKEKRKLAKERITFPLAAFLVGAQENAFFIYNWGYRMQYGCLDWYSEFDRPLGKPLGDAKYNGWEITREFEHQTVRINLETREAEIIQKK
ncbi:hypothetical protein EYV94_07495 [Puteibacter caeruleilacunae]|nr:hypothetical protein EYV94_07495 [Puteibacter caeruleilacunae]